MGSSLSSRVRSVWVRVLSLSWPMLLQNVFRTAMRTTDIIVTGVLLGWGVTGVYAGLVLFYRWSAAIVGWGFARGDWADRATAMMDERGSRPTPSPPSSDADSGEITED